MVRLIKRTKNGLAYFSICNYSKDVRLPVQLQRAMAAEAEAAREARAKVINYQINYYMIKYFFNLKFFLGKRPVGILIMCQKNVFVCSDTQVNI